MPSFRGRIRGSGAGLKLGGVVGLYADAALSGVPGLPRRAGWASRAGTMGIAWER